MAHDLKSRTKAYCKNITLFCKRIKEDTASRPTVSQSIRSAVSIGANYIETNDYPGKKNFHHLLKIS